MGLLDNKNCVVTGAAGSIGLASVKRLLAEGANVLLVDLNEDLLAKATESLTSHGDKAAGFAADVTEADQTQAYLDEAVNRWGKIDVIFSNAGASGEISPITDYPEEVFDRVMAVNVRASFLACKYGLPRMNDGGSIIINLVDHGGEGKPHPTSSPMQPRNMP